MKRSCEFPGCEHEPTKVGGRFCVHHENQKLLEKVGLAISALENIQILGDSNYKSDRARRALAELKAR